jgi:hypothetical protein
LYITIAMATIVVEKNTRTKLKSVGRKEQTYDDIINELLKRIEKRPADSHKSAEQEVL